MGKGSRDQKISYEFLLILKKEKRGHEFEESKEMWEGLRRKWEMIHYNM